MKHGLWKTTLGASAAGALALTGATVAVGAGSSTKGAASTTTTTTAATAKAHSPETELTGDTLAKVKAAAIAKVAGTVDRATTENDSSNSAAAYEAHVTKADGTHVTVILDSSFTVLSVETGGGRGHGGPGDHGHGFGGPGGPGGSGETALTGTVATQAKAAAVAKAGGTADEATTENDNSNAAALYEVHVTKADGSHVKVILDKDYNVLTVETGPSRPLQN
jgi:uncharacterized membrane protein YkoI